jgi:hypothetical protein
MNPSKGSKKANQYEKKYARLPLEVQLRDPQTELNPAIDQEIPEKALVLDELADSTDAKLNDQITGRGKKWATSEFHRKVAGHELKLKLEQEPSQLGEESEALAVRIQNEQYEPSGTPGEMISNLREPIPITDEQKIMGNSNRVPISAPNSVGLGFPLFSPISGASKNPFQVEAIEFLVSGTPSDGPRTTNVCPTLRDILRQAASKWNAEATRATDYPWFMGSETVRCANTRTFGTNNANKTACLRCCYARTPCVLTVASRLPVVLPLAAPMPGATPYDTGYYISDRREAWTRTE